MRSTASSEFIATLSGPDRSGIVASVAGTLLGLGCTIHDSQQFRDPQLDRFFMRVRFASEVGPLAESLVREQLADAVSPYAMTMNLQPTATKHRLLVMVSRFGHCLNDLLFRVGTNTLNAEIAAVVSNHTDFEQLVEHYGVPFHHVPITPDTKKAGEDELRKLIDYYDIDTVVLARYMQVLSADLSAELSGRAINIHHSLLPSFKGANPYGQAHTSGVKVVGATAHYITADLDEGPIIEQDFVRVSHRHGALELAAIGRDLETRALARAVQAHVDNRVLLHGQRTVVFD